MPTFTVRMLLCKTRHIPLLVTKHGMCPGLQLGYLSSGARTDTASQSEAATIDSLRHPYASLRGHFDREEREHLLVIIYNRNCQGPQAFALCVQCSVTKSHNAPVP